MTEGGDGRDGGDGGVGGGAATVTATAVVCVRVFGMREVTDGDDWLQAAEVMQVMQV